VGCAFATSGACTRHGAWTTLVVYNNRILEKQTSRQQTLWGQDDGQDVCRCCTSSRRTQVTAQPLTVNKGNHTGLYGPNCRDFRPCWPSTQRLSYEAVLQYNQGGNKNVLLCPPRHSAVGQNRARIEGRRRNKNRHTCLSMTHTLCLSGIKR
jgi:hypothetical protein